MFREFVHVYKWWLFPDLMKRNFFFAFTLKQLLFFRVIEDQTSFDKNKYRNHAPSKDEWTVSNWKVMNSHRHLSRLKFCKKTSFSKMLLKLRARGCIWIDTLYSSNLYHADTCIFFGFFFMKNNEAIKDKK